MRLLTRHHRRIREYAQKDQCLKYIKYLKLNNDPEQAGSSIQQSMQKLPCVCTATAGQLPSVGWDNKYINSN